MRPRSENTARLRPMSGCWLCGSTLISRNWDRTTAGGRGAWTMSARCWGRVIERMVDVLPEQPAFSSTDPPAAKRLAVVKNAYERRQQRRQENDASQRAVTNAGGPSVKDHLEKKVEKYNDLPAIRHGCEDFSPLSCWHDGGSPSHDVHGIIVAPAELPILSDLARAYLSVDSTSCQSEGGLAAGSHVQ